MSSGSLLPHRPLPASALRWTCDPKTLGFTSTAELEPVDELIGQERALSAIDFGTRIAEGTPAAIKTNPDVIKAAGFAGGGTFTLWSPDVSFGSGSADDTPLATVLPLDFFQKGFATYNITSYKTLLLPNSFVNSSGVSLGGNNAVIIMDDADLDLALKGCTFAAVGTAGAHGAVLGRHHGRRHRRCRPSHS